MINLVRKHGGSDVASNESSNTTEDTEQSNTSKKTKRQLTTATFEKWQRNYEREYQTFELVTMYYCKGGFHNGTEPIL